MEGHPVIGSWQWTNMPGTPREDISFAIFTGTGGYVEAGEGGFVAIGVWRATGERTAELVLNPSAAILTDEVFAPRYVVKSECLVIRDSGFLRIMIEVDATGNRLTGTGAFELPDGNGGVTQIDPYTGRGDRMAIVLDTTATPTA